MKVGASGAVFSKRKTCVKERERNGQRAVMRAGGREGREAEGREEGRERVREGIGFNMPGTY